MKTGIFYLLHSTINHSIYYVCREIKYSQIIIFPDRKFHSKNDLNKFYFIILCQNNNLFQFLHTLKNHFMIWSHTFKILHIKVDVYTTRIWKNFVRYIIKKNCANQIKKINWLIEGRVWSINDDEIYVNDNGFTVLFCKLGLPDFFSFDMPNIFSLQSKTISVNPTSGL